MFGFFGQNILFGKINFGKNVCFFGKKHGQKHFFWVKFVFWLCASFNLLQTRPL